MTSELYFSHTQSKSEESFFANLNINWKFDKLISAIMEKSWPRDDQGNPQEDEEVVLQHLLSWGAAKNILKLYGIWKKNIHHISFCIAVKINVCASKLSLYFRCR